MERERGVKVTTDVSTDKHLLRLLCLVRCGSRPWVNVANGRVGFGYDQSSCMPKFSKQVILNGLETGWALGIFHTITHVCIYIYIYFKKKKYIFFLKNYATNYLI